MDITKQDQEQQEAIQLQGRMTSFFGDYCIGTLLNKSVIRKLKKISAMMLFSVIFMMPFEGKNFCRGIIVNNSKLPFRKTAACDLLSNPRHIWQYFLLSLAIHVSCFFSRLTEKKKRKSFDL